MIGMNDMKGFFKVLQIGMDEMTSTLMEVVDKYIDDIPILLAAMVATENVLRKEMDDSDENLAKMADFIIEKTRCIIIDQDRISEILGGTNE
jgi:hypothetical protein